jgi:putative FmdB family regulatory protein
VPTYQYACTACGHHLEAVQSFTDEPLTECPACAGRLRKLFSSVGVVFKGSGFYRNDSRKAPSESSPQPAGTADKPGSGEKSGPSEKSGGGEKSGPSEKSGGGSSEGAGRSGSTSAGQSSGSSSQPSSPATAGSTGS